MIINKINKLKKTFNELEIDGYVIPKNDEFFSEYSKVNKLKIILIIKILYKKMILNLTRILGTKKIIEVQAG